MPGYEEIYEFSQRLLNEEFDPDLRPSSYVWHYTDSAGLAGILRSRHIRLSDPAFLNDPKEIKTGQEATDEVLSAFSSEGSAEQAFVTEFSQFRSTERLYLPYVFSLCSPENDLTLWRLYGDDGFGFSLGFPISELRDDLNFQAGRREIPANVYIYKVMYDPQRQRDLIRKLLNFVFKRFSAEGGTAQSENRKRVAYNLLFEMIGFFLPLIKDKAYSGEEENRVVLHGHDVRYADMDFSLKRGYLKPYIDFPVEGGLFPEFPVHTIYVGPQAPFEQAKESLRLFFENQDLAKYQIQVKPSGLAYRS